MSDEPNATLTSLTHFLEECGHSPEEARALALEAFRKQAAIDEGVTYGHIHAEQLGTIWHQAAKHGKRKLVLEITADALGRDEWDGHISVAVRGAQTWDEYEQAQAGARAKAVN